MIEVKYIPEESIDGFSFWLRKGLGLGYSTNLVPEQKNVPFEYALEEMRKLVEGCDMIVVHNGLHEYAACCLAYSQTSHHKVGCGTVIQTMVSNNSTLTRKLLQIVKMLARTNPDKQTWLYLSKRVSAYTYKGQYYELRS